jgi:hypothetical protein
MLTCEIDHLVITAPSLSAGNEYVRQKLGVSPQVGGKHSAMGTHNCLVKLGDTVYLEVIAADPEAPQPGRPRWYEMDALETNSLPRLATWVARVNEIDEAWAIAPIPLGRIEAMSRGQLNWRLTVPPDGRLALQGAAPTLIQWAAGPHPASLLKDCGCSLVRLQGFHPEAGKIAALLKTVGFAGPFRIAPLPTGQKPYLVATIATPSGLRQLGVP